jgi:protein O-GlcNAc transferase
MNASDRDGLLGRATAAVRDNDLAQARTLLTQALALAPGDPRVRDALARLALRDGDVKGAVAHCRAGLAAAPNDPALLTTLGHALRAAGMLDAAVEALGAAAMARPDDAEAWMAAGNACMEAEFARADARRARAPAPGAMEEFLTAAMHSFARVAALRPGTAAPQAHLAMAARYACAWPQAQVAAAALAACHRDDPARFACSPMMAVALLGDATPQRDAIAGWSRANLPGTAAPAFVRQRGQRLRVGYLSSDLHDHATAHLMAGLFEGHNRARIETFAYAADRDDGSAMRRRLRAAFAHWRDVRDLDDGAAAGAIAEDALDVLVDLKGHTHGSRLSILAHRPAPVQLHYLGFPGTLACAGIDGFIGDAITVPEGSEAEFAEPVLRLPVCYQVNDAQRPLPPAPTRASAGLPDDALVLACFNQTYKVTEPFFATWLAALRAHPRAVLWLAVPHVAARRNLAAFAETAGVARARIVFAPLVPQAAHVARLRCADLALDVLPYGSHTTGSDALWAGVPLLTCRGRTFAGRVGASLCHAVGLDEMVTDDLAAYARLLDALCGDPTRLAALRHHLETRRTTLPLFDTAAFTRAFEALLEHAAGGVA